jgi:polyribonucleotide nucleotidyltransferase
MLHRTTVTVGSTELIFETGRIAKQAAGSVMVRCGETMVLSAVTYSPDLRPGQDFFPMTVDYREKAYAAGHIPGNFFRREARPSEREILVCRLTDRPLRPLFPKGFYNETQVCQTVFSADNIHDPDVLSINAASAALHISELPFNGPIGAVRVGLIADTLVVNPTIEEMEESDLDLVVAGTSDAIIMVEGSALEVPEDKMLEALEFAHENIKRIIIAINELRANAGVEKMVFEAPKPDETIVADVEAIAKDKLKAALAIGGKHERHNAIRAVRDEVMTTLQGKYGDERFAEVSGEIKAVFGSLEKRLMRGQVIESNRRLDGRGLDEVRPIEIELGILPRAHGSAMFQRGETQAIVVTTLGTTRDELRQDELVGDTFSRFFLHYNFPAWSVGEARRIMGPGRREIGHGKLAERALQSVIPPEEDEQGNHFPYTIRIVSEVTESNGSSSMASVCGGSLSMMDAGVQTSAPVAGVAMGLIKEGDEVRVLTDILGDEDHLGDMDFKVCGTEAGITAFQIGLQDCRPEPRDHAAGARSGAPRPLAHSRKDERRAAGRSSGAVALGAAHHHDFDSAGQDSRYHRPGRQGDPRNPELDRRGHQHRGRRNGPDRVRGRRRRAAAVEMIRSLTAEAEVGAIYHGTVTRLMNFGAFVNIVGTQEGLVHISEFAPGHVASVEDVVDVGDEIDVKVIEIDSMGRVNLSKVQADIELGRVSQEEYDEGKRRGGGGGHRGGGDRGGRGGDRGGRGGGGHRGGDRGPRRGGHR